MTKKQYDFLRNEFLTLTIFGALGRSNTYADSVSEKDKNDFRSALREELDNLSKQYRISVSEDAHISNIINLSKRLSSRFPNCLRDKRFRIGIAQKTLNLFLKYALVY